MKCLLGELTHTVRELCHLVVVPMNKQHIFPILRKDTKERTENELRLQSYRSYNPFSCSEAANQIAYYKALKVKTQTRGGKYVLLSCQTPAVHYVPISPV